MSMWLDFYYFKSLSHLLHSYAELKSARIMTSRGISAISRVSTDHCVCLGYPVVSNSL